MNKENLKEILNLIFETKEKDDRKQEAFKDIFKIISPDSHYPYIEIDITQGMINILNIISPNI
jgi:hypothetical protein